GRRARRRRSRSQSDDAGVGYPHCPGFVAGVRCPGTGDVTEVGAVPDCRRDADLHRYAADRQRGDAAVAESDVEWGAFERGEGDLVEVRLARAWGDCRSRVPPAATPSPDTAERRRRSRQEARAGGGRRRAPLPPAPYRVS